MKTFTVELWAQQDLGRAEVVTLPEDVTVDLDNRNTLCVLSRFLIKYTNGARTLNSTYQKRPLMSGDVVRIGTRRFVFFIAEKPILGKDLNHKNKDENELTINVLELSHL